MLPVPRSCLIKLDINSVTNEYSKVHISKELAFCRRERDKIFKQAEKTYFRVTNKVNEQLVKNSCDFKVLEQAYVDYCLEYGINNSQTESEKFIAKAKDIKDWSEEATAQAKERLDMQEKDKSYLKR